MSYTCNGYFGFIQSEILWLAVLLATAAVGLDIFKSMSLGLAANCRSNAYIEAAVGCYLIYAAATTLSLSAAFGLYATLKDHKAGQADAVKQAYTLTVQRYNDLKRDLKRLGPVKPLSILKAKLISAKSHPRWRPTQGCADVTRAVSQRFCQNYASLQGQLDLAQQAAKLKKQIEIEHQKLRRFDLKIIHTSSDAQIEKIAAVFKASKDTVEFWISAIFAIAFEIASGLGFYVLKTGTIKKGDDQSIKTSTSDASADTTSEYPHGINQFFSTCINVQKGLKTYIEAGKLLDCYTVWCKDHDIAKPLGRRLFGEMMKQRGLDRRRITVSGRKVTVYRGLSFKDLRQDTVTSHIERTQ